VSSLDPATVIGRPRNPDTDRDIVSAVLDLMSEGATLTSLSLVTIARRAGVSRNSLYRRWKTKEDLYSDVVKTINRALPDVSEHSARENLIKLLTVTLGRMADQRVRRMDQAILAEVQSFPDLYDEYLADVVVPLDRSVKLAVRRGKETGEIRVDVDENLFSELLVSLVVARMSSIDFGDLDAESSSRLITDLVFKGVSPV
jgi:AcrR family transcriptional regulator